MPFPLGESSPFWRKGGEAQHIEKAGHSPQELGPKDSEWEQDIYALDLEDGH